MTTEPPRIPAPAHPIDRREALPWERPKDEVEDAQVPALLRAILEHPSYLEADRDVDLLHHAELRGVRLQLDYTKAERALAEQGIQSCVVVFGSTRLSEPETAAKALHAARASVATHPEDAARARALRAAERALELARYYEIGREFGRLVARAAEEAGGRRLVVMTGGGPGGMEAANRGAFEAGAPSVGLNITLPREQYPNPYVTPGLCFSFHYFALRKLHFMKRAVAILALPGGFGTLDELFGALTLIQTRKMAPIPVVLIGRSYWRRVLDLEFLVEAGTIAAEDLELLWFAETANEAWEGILAWYRLAGRSPFDGPGDPRSPTQTASP